MEVDSVF